MSRGATTVQATYDRYASSLLHPKSNISNQNSSGNITGNKINLPEETNTNSAIAETERKILDGSSNAFLENSNETNEKNLVNMGTTTKLSTADSCSRSYI